MRITLNDSEMLQAALIGCTRHIENLTGKTPVKNNYGAPEERDWQFHVDGAMGEMALAKYLNRFYAGRGERGAPDVGDDEVRTTHYSSGHLVLHPRDPPDRRAWLLTGLNGKYMVRGWIMIREGQQQRFWGVKKAKDRPAFWVPQEALHERNGQP